ncbi:MAG: hypothetical protein CM1200mP29_12930 [Verrucomicrobiota bacterium]|nr:MAG: hypothetical protein CM1200mP29_12930 [Verrucomicrobiota bacterium]
MAFSRGFFGVTLLLYFVGFYGVEHLRERKGPWRVEFDAAATGGPTAIIHHRSLGIEGFRMYSRARALVGSRVVWWYSITPSSTRGRWTRRPRAVRNSSSDPLWCHLASDLPGLDVPPGVVTMNLLGHEIELMPRTLVIDKQEIPWSTPAGGIAVPPPIKGEDATSN